MPRKRGIAMPSIEQTAMRRAREDAGYTREHLAAEIHGLQPELIIGPTTLADFEAGYMDARRNEMMCCLYELVLGEVGE